MQEYFLHYIWSLQYFDKTDLFTTEGERLDLFYPGTLNGDSGPDFSNARLRLGDMDWVGNIEVHTLSSGWLDHHHEIDPAYDSVILHVVWREDKRVFRRDNSSLPTIELQGRVEESLVRNYRQLIGSSFSIPCCRSFPSVEPVTRYSMVEKAVAQRLERKASEVLGLLERCRNSWDETTYQLLARAFGFKVNADPMIQLARALPLKLIRKQPDLFHTEALLFGQSGFLEAHQGDDYYLALQKEYRLQAHKHSMTGCMTKSQWKFLRMRPPNFPTTRLAQWGAILHARQNLYADIMDVNSLPALFGLLKVSPSDYWVKHYQFSKQSMNGFHELGKGSMEVIIVNAVIPLWAAYSIRMDDQQYMDRALAIMEQLPAEVNSITRKWSDLGMEARNSFEAQGLIELFNTFCQRKSCLHCSIGASLIRPHQHEHPPPIT